MYLASDKALHPIFVETLAMSSRKRLSHAAYVLKSAPSRVTTQAPSTESRT